ncbi:Pyridoxal-5'-phosphate-dependent protein beta subunit [Fibrella aestuarina BUZ 2]|uniref:Pyridoxal-5'-phosphate-dependent protein beta subunit n=1 Tax=Fibrella aestuarina BUZ 2 TaxID=1166018 RepID=I0K901_9BACT|nr:pyridoxal-phosphate dependent enzyme [Fibrella aestuarina]CCH00604.1 Pyridoxal-5'-phosphate-dependent protein beta subunit [Fibrella aestuarina BUZ 2]
MPLPDLAAHLNQIVGHSALDYLPDPFPEPVPIRLFLKRDDQLHPLVSGNKWRKLKYNLLAAREQGLSTILTFGGAFSNHLHATAAAGKLFGFQTIGVVRGDELAHRPLNPTLTFCREQGMHLHFVSRTDYRRATDPTYLVALQAQFGPCYLVPEGGTNALAIRGTAEIMPEIEQQWRDIELPEAASAGTLPHTVACAVGTAGTLAGLIASAPESVRVLGVSALKGAVNFAALPSPLPATVQLSNQYDFGGYARTTPELDRFIEVFEERTGVRLEPTYTGKLLYALYDLARQGYFPEQAGVVAVHTGGLQIRG